MLIWQYVYQIRQKIQLYLAYLVIKKVGVISANLFNMRLMPMRVSAPLPGQDDGWGGHRRRV